MHRIVIGLLGYLAFGGVIGAKVNWFAGVLAIAIPVMVIYIAIKKSERFDAYTVRVIEDFLAKK